MVIGISSIPRYRISVIGVAIFLGGVVPNPKSFPVIGTKLGGVPTGRSGLGRDLLCDNAGTGFSSVPPRSI